MAAEEVSSLFSQGFEFDYLENFSMAKEIFRGILTTKTFRHTLKTQNIMKRINCYIQLGLILLLITSISLAQDTYYSQGSGVWGVVEWNSERDGSGLILTDPDQRDVVIQDGHIISLPNNSNYRINNLSIETGGKLFTGSAGSNIYLQVFGPDVMVEGQLGNGETYDAIGLEVMGVNCTISGDGEIDLSRLRKVSGANDTTDLIIDTDLRLRYTIKNAQINQRTAMYNAAIGEAFNITINEGNTVLITGRTIDDEFFPGSVSIDGPDGTNSINYYGSLTVNGVLNISGDLFVTTDNTNNDVVTYTVNGKLIVDGRIIGNDKIMGSEAEVPGTGTAELILNEGGTLELTGSGEVITNIDGMRDNFQFDPNAQIIFNSSETQEIYSGFTYPNLAIEGGGLKTISDDGTELEITHELTLSDGILQSDLVPVFVNNPESEAIQGMSESSYIQGTLRRSVISNFSYHFPIGDATDGYSSMDINVTQAGVDTDVSVRYSHFNQAIEEDLICEIEGQGNTEINYDCVTGQWSVDAADFGYEMTLNPSVASLGNCGTYEYLSIRKDGATVCNPGIVNVPFNSFSEFNIATASSFGNLPVDLLSFDATHLDQGYVEVSWVTASELNNSHFELERSVDGIHYEVIAQIPGAGTTQEVQQYSYRDMDTFQGRYYYRLRQVDFDGSFEYFYTVEVIVKGTSTIGVLAAYPNPVEDTYHMEISLPGEQPATMIVYDMQGNQVWGGRLNRGRVGYHAFEIDASVWKAGVYVYRLAMGEESVQGKIIKK